MPKYKVLVRADIPKIKYFEVEADSELQAEEAVYDLALEDARDDWSGAYDQDVITICDVVRLDEETD